MVLKKAVLFIHGLGGNNSSLLNLFSNLSVQKYFDVFTFNLPGHGDRLKHEDFIRSAEKHIQYIMSLGYKDIYVVGHSMGGVIASYIASKYREVKKLVLVSPAFHYLGVKDDKIDFLGTLKSGVSILKETDLDNFFGNAKKIPFNAPLEFIHLVKDYYEAPLEVRCPCLIIWGNSDIVVPFSSARYVFESLKSRSKCLIVVRGVGHNPFVSSRRDIVSDCVLKFLNSSDFKNKCVVNKII